MSNLRSQWQSQTSYLLVMIGATVGLGNIVQFPYLVTKYGGLFILFFILCEILVSIPLLFAELVIGRSGRQNPVGSIGILATISDANSRWRWLGWLAACIAFLTLAYYSVQAAFPLSYFIGSLKTLSIYGVDEPVPVAVYGGEVMTAFYPLEICFVLFLILAMWVIVRGIHRGLEKISWIIVPTYFIILLVLAAYILTAGGLSNSIKVLFSTNPHQSMLTVLFAAMSYALFKLGVGMGTMIVYGSYIPFSATFGRTTILIVCFDALISLLSFFILYPIILQSNNFLNNLNNHNVIYLFSGIPNGILIACLYFLAAVMAAWTCTIAMAETATITLIERFNITRRRAACIIFLGALAVGSFAAMTHTEWMNVMLSQSIPLRGIVKNITGNFLVPCSALFIAIFAGWIMRREIAADELGFKSKIFSVWLFLVRYVAPIIILIVALGSFYIVFLMPELGN